MLPKCSVNSRACDGEERSVPLVVLANPKYYSSYSYTQYGGG